MENKLIIKSKVIAKVIDLIKTDGCIVSFSEQPDGTYTDIKVKNDLLEIYVLDNHLSVYLVKESVVFDVEITETEKLLIQKEASIKLDKSVNNDFNFIKLIEKYF